MDSNSLFIGILAGIVGGAYLLYGRKTSRVAPMVCGVGLMVCGFLIDLENPSQLRRSVRLFKEEVIPRVGREAMSVQAN